MKSRPSPAHRPPMWHLPLVVTACLCVLLVLSFMRWCDAPVVAWVASHQNKAIGSAARMVSKLGDWPSLALMTAAAFACAALFRSRRWMRILALVFIASLVAGAAANPVRALTGRARPNAKVQPGWHGPFSEGRWVVGKHKYSSFPSAHMAVVVAMAVPLMLYGRRAGLLGAGVAAAVGWSRIYLNAHHLSDVAAGLMLGLGCGLALCLSPVVHFWLGAALTAAAERWRRLAVPTPSPPAAAPASRCQLQTS